MTAGLCATLVTPWASSPLAAGRATSAHSGETCLEPDAQTFPVRINVGTYRPPRPGQAPEPRKADHLVDSFRYLISLDNSGDPADPDPANHPGVHPLASTSPILTEGAVDGNTKVLDLPRQCRWLVTIQANVESPGRRRESASHKMWGVSVDLRDTPGPGYQPRDEDRNGNVVKWVDEIPFPLPLGKLVVRVFGDTNPTNGAPDISEIVEVGSEGPGLENFRVFLHDSGGGVVTRNFHGDPICSKYDGSGNLIPGSGGKCLTRSDGRVFIENLAPGTYAIDAFPPESASEPWHGAIQTTTFEGDATIDFGTVMENDDGTSLISAGLAAPLDNPAAYRFGFVTRKDLAAGPTGTIRACAAHSVSFPPFDTPVINKNEPIVLGWVALSSVSSQRQVYAAPLGDSPSCPGGVIHIRGVPDGNYTMFIWDERLERVSRTIDVSVGSRPTDDVNTPFVDERTGELPGDDGHGNIGVFRWTGWLSGTVFDDNGVAKNGARLGPHSARNGLRDCLSPKDLNTCERGLANRVLDIRFRDGSTKKATSTDANGRYEYPAEVSELARFVVGEVVSSLSGSSGPCRYSEATSRRDPEWSSSQYNPLAKCVALESSLGDGLRTTQLTTPGHRSTVDWGTYAYGPDEGGRIGGVVTYATTRREVDPRFARAEPYEPGIAGVPVNLYWAGPNQQWNGGPGPGSDDVLVSRYANGAGTDAFEHPSAGNQGANGGCEVLDSAGNPVFPAPQTHFGLRVAPNCLEFGVTSNETKDGTFDGNFAFADMCSPADGGWKDAYVDANRDHVGCARRAALASGDYVVEVAAAENPSTPDFPYKIVAEEDVNSDQPESSPNVTAAPCVGPDHRVGDVRSPFSGQERPLCTHREVTLGLGQSNLHTNFFLFTETPIPGRISGHVSDHLRVETDPDSPWYGMPRGVPNAPVGIRDYAYRLLQTVATDEYGFYESVLPSAQTATCRSQAGACPATYVFVINDPYSERVVTGTVSTSGRTVRGSGTHFKTEVAVGDHIRVGNDVRVVTDLASNTALAVDRTWSRARTRKAMYVLFTNPNFNPNYGTESRAFAVMPGKTTFLDTPLDPISGATCSASAGPEFFAVQPSNGDGAPADPDGGVVVNGTLRATAELRNVTIRGLGFGTERTNPRVSGLPGHITLVHPNGKRYVLDDDSYYGGAGSPKWSDEQITFRFPRVIGTTTLPGAPYQVLISTASPTKDQAGSRATPTGITLHYIRASGYDPPRRYVDGSSGDDVRERGSLASPYRTVQYAIDRAFAEKAPGRLIIVAPAVYRENPVLYIRAKLQGFGPGGINGSSVSLDPSEDDVRRHALGTVIDASAFSYDPTIQRIWQARINGRTNDHFPGGPLEGSRVKTHAGAGITVVGNKGTYRVRNPALDRATIDGFGIQSARADAVFGTGGGGGIFVNGNGRSLWLTNNFIAGNEGNTGGGIILGQPYRGRDGNAGNNNEGIRIGYNRIVGNGGARWAGGVAIYNGADDYLVDHNDLCSNVSAETGGAIAHYGRSPGGRIAENVISFNSATDSGGGLIIAGQLPPQGASGEGTGRVTVERNILAGNQSGGDGGAIKVLEAVRQAGNARKSAAPDQIMIANNQLTNNIAEGAGGALALRDSPNVWIVNNTIARNASSASCEACAGSSPHAGGLASEPHSDWLRSLLPPGSAAFSNPLLLNNLFYENASYRFDPAALPAPDGVDALVFLEFRDFEVLGHPDLRFRPWHSTLSAAYDSGDPVANATNQVFGEEGESPFVELTSSQFEAGFNARTGRAAVDVVSLPEAQVLLPGDDGVPGNYHLCPSRSEPIASDFTDSTACSTIAVDAGAASLPGASFAGTVVPELSSTVLAPMLDIDGDPRPTGASRDGSPPDIGADEMAHSGSGRGASGAPLRAVGARAPRASRNTPPDGDPNRTSRAQTQPSGHISPSRAGRQLTRSSG